LRTRDCASRSSGSYEEPLSSLLLTHPEMQSLVAQSPRLGEQCRVAWRRSMTAPGVSSRHSAAVRAPTSVTSRRVMAEHGIAISEIAQYLRHSNERVTFSTYARYSPAHLRQAAAPEYDDPVQANQKSATLIEAKSLPDMVGATGIE